MEMQQKIMEVMRELPEFDPDGMTPKEIAPYLEKVKAVYATLEQMEPADPDSEEFLEWEEALEDLDSLMDEISDMLDESV
ncbi:MAG: hypothetical protein IJ088_04015 [Clostridia bacterium]|nr:hypothetical protein [Clostridia bacterium]